MSNLNKFHMIAGSWCYKLEYPYTVGQFMEINRDLPIYLMWIDMKRDEYVPELVGYYGYNGKSLWFGSEDGRAGTPWLEQMKNFVACKLISFKAPINHVAIRDTMHTIQDIVVTDKKIEIHMYEIDEALYEQI